jgi:hypothetical protein
MGARRLSEEGEPTHYSSARSRAKQNRNRHQIGYDIIGIQLNYSRHQQAAVISGTVQQKTCSVLKKTEAFILTCILKLLLHIEIRVLSTISQHCLYATCRGCNEVNRSSVSLSLKYRMQSFICEYVSTPRTASDR